MEITLKGTLMNDTLKLLIKSGVHFGHQTSRWNPKMAPYIWGAKNGIHLIDVSKTAHQLTEASKFLESIASQGKSILWVGTKKAAQEIVERIGKELNSPYVVHRWVGGSFSNYRQVRKSVQNLMHMEDIIAKAKSEESIYSKKELNTIQKRIDRLVKNVGGIRQLAWPVGAVVVVDVKKEHVCIKEALTTGIPIVALVDTNSDPSNIDYVIPANDDVPRSVAVLMNFLSEAVKRGQEVAAANKPAVTTQDNLFEMPVDGNITGLEEDEDEQNKKRRATAGAGVKPKKTGPTRPITRDSRAPKRPVEGKKFAEESQDVEGAKAKKARKSTEESPKAIAE